MLYMERTKWRKEYILRGHTRPLEEQHISEIWDLCHVIAISQLPIRCFHQLNPFNRSIDLLFDPSFCLRLVSCFLSSLVLFLSVINIPSFNSISFQLFLIPPTASFIIWRLDLDNQYGNTSSSTMGSHSAYIYTFTDSGWSQSEWRLDCWIKSSKQFWEPRRDWAKVGWPLPSISRGANWCVGRKSLTYCKMLLTSLSKLSVARRACHLLR